MISIIFFLAVLLVVAVIDYLTKSIYDIVLIIGAIVCFPLLYFLDGRSILSIVYGVLWGFGSYGLIYVAARLIYGTEAFGQGDVLFNAFIAGFLGFVPAVISSFLTFFVALLMLIAGWIWKRKIDRNAEIPLAPAMSVSAAICVFYSDVLLDFIMNLYA